MATDIMNSPNRLPRRRGREPFAAPRLTDEEVAAQLRALAASTTAENTKRTYRSAIQQFINWGGLLPTDENTLLRYLAEHSDVLNARTLAHRLSALSKWHTHQGFLDPTTSTRVRSILQGITRRNGTPPRQAKALTVENMEAIAQTLARDATLASLRDNALLQIGFLGGFRSAELVAITVEELIWEPRGLTVVIPRSKTDQFGEGKLRTIPYGVNSTLCAVTALRAWIEAADVASGPVFRPLTRTGHIRKQSLGAGSVTTILVKRAAQAGLENVEQLSSHSLRRGMATSARRAGADFTAIKRQGGWKRDEMVLTYIEEADRFENNAAAALLKIGK